MAPPFNFSAGPSALPRPVLEEARRELVDYGGTGMSLLEVSHRSPTYEQVHSEALALAHRLFETPESFSVLFLQGGASLQFAMVPLNLLMPGDRGGYVESGAWGRKALQAAAHHGDAYVAWDGAAAGYARMPADSELKVEAGTRYLHVTSNETINGLRLSNWPRPGVPLVADMSSDVLTRTIPWDVFDLVYAGAQKNLGPAGVTVVWVRTSVLGVTREDLAPYLRYADHHRTRSLLNTPPVAAVWLMGKVLTWIEAEGGLTAMEKTAEARAGAMYQAIDDSDGFYRSWVAAPDRSLTNVVFRLPSDHLESDFLAAAEAAGMVGLAGHRSVGGIRASLYNAMPLAGAERLAEFMQDFRRRSRG